MFRYLMLVFFISCCLASCKSQDKAKVANSENTKMELVLSGDYSGFEKEQLLKIDSKAELEDFFGKINRTRKPGIPIPDIDFTSKSVIVRLKGTTNNNNPDITLKNLSNESLVLKKIKSDSIFGTTAVLTPFFIYSIPKTGNAPIIR